MRDARRPWYGAMAIVFAVALAIRVGVTAKFVGLDAPPSASANPDQLDYEAFAWRVAQGQGYALEDGTPTARRPPGTSLVIAPVYAVFGRSFTAARLWLCVLSAATCVVCGAIGAMAFGRRVGLLAAGGLALYPGHFYYAMHMLSETPYALGLALATLATLVSVKRSSTPWVILAGVLWAATLLARPQVLLLPVVVLPVLVLAGRRPLYRTAALMMMACALTLSPWLVRNAVVMDRLAMTTGFGHVMWGAHNDATFTEPHLRGRWVATSTLLQDTPFRGNEAALDQHAMRQAQREIREHVWEMPLLTLMKLVRLIEPIHDTPNTLTRLAFTLGWGATGLLLLPGIALAWRRNRADTFVLLLPLAATVLMTVVTYGLDRFRDSSAPLFMPLAAVAGVAVFDALRRPQRDGGHEPIQSSHGAPVG